MSVKIVNDFEFLSRETPDLGTDQVDQPDICCPKCQEPIKLPFIDYNDGYYTPAIVQNYKAQVECSCGCTFEAGVESVTVKFYVRKNDVVIVRCNGEIVEVGDNLSRTKY